MQKNKKMGIKSFPFLAVLILGLGLFLAGCSYDNANSSIDFPKDNGEVNVEKISNNILIAAEDMIEEQFDDYAKYFSKDDYEKFLSSITGKYYGIGVYIAYEPKKERVIVTGVMRGGPAEKAGMKAGDEFIKINGESVEKIDSSILSSKLKGNKKENLNIVVYRPNVGEISLNVTRDEVKVPSVDGKMLFSEEGIGYISISTFNDSTYNEFMNIVSKLLYEKMKYLIIDLRNNGGGEVEQALNIADELTENGALLLQTINKDGIIHYKGTQIGMGIPVYILQNENTASASEMLIGALIDNKVAINFGVTSYGKGIVQSIMPIIEGGGIRITTAKYLTPSGYDLHKKGIEPQVKVEKAKGDNIMSQNIEEDAQLKEVVEYIREHK